MNQLKKLDYRGFLFNNNKNNKMKHLIFGYGSLVNRESRNRTSFTWKEIVVNLIWYKRWWYFRTEKSKTTSVWIVKSENSTCNWILFEVDDLWLELFDKREFWYKRVELEKEKIVSNNFNIDEIKIWTYVVNDIEYPNVNFPIAQSYIDIIMNGYLDVSESFVIEFIMTTEWWEYHWINDRNNSVFNIQIDNSKINIFNNLLNKFLSKKNNNLNFLLEENY